MIFHVYTSLGTCACMVYLFEEHYPEPSYKLAASYMYVTLQENGSEAADPTSPPDMKCISHPLPQFYQGFQVLSFLSPEHPVPAGSLTTLKIVGDNIDKDVKPRNMRSDYQTRSLHYFHAYAVRDRLNLDNCDDCASAPNPSTIDLELLLPSKEDEMQIRSNMGILIARTLKKHIPYFSKYGKGVERHIMHSFYEEMSQKSNVVSKYDLTKYSCMYIHMYFLC